MRLQASIYNVFHPPPPTSNYSSIPRRRQFMYFGPMKANYYRVFTLPTLDSCLSELNLIDCPSLHLLMLSLELSTVVCRENDLIGLHLTRWESVIIFFWTKLCLES